MRGLLIVLAILIAIPLLLLSFCFALDKSPGISLIVGFVAIGFVLWSIFGATATKKSTLGIIICGLLLLIGIAVFAFFGFGASAMIFFVAIAVAVSAFSSPDQKSDHQDNLVDEDLTGKSDDKQS